VRFRVLVLALVAALAAPAAALAGDPTLPLAQVHAGMACTGYTVVQGTTIASFDVAVLGVVAPTSNEEARILVRVSGPAIGASGIAQGMSGSPVYCPGADGAARTIGALSQTVGQYGNSVGLVTPIELMLGEPATPPRAARRAPRLLRSARPIGESLTVGGLSPELGAALTRATRRAGRPFVAAPAGAGLDFPVQTLVPGASVAVGFASGDLDVGGVGTVSYVDGANVWAFGHPLENAGARSLLLRDAYVYGVIDNPGTGDQGTSYKLAAAGHELGTLTNDAPNAIVGRIGALPSLVPLSVFAKDLDSGRTRGITTLVADESGVDWPGGDALDLVGELALAQQATTILRGVPERQSGRLCVRFELEELQQPLRFCNRYVGEGTLPEDAFGTLVDQYMAVDFGQAANLISSYAPARLHVTKVQVSLALRRGLALAYALAGWAPRTVRAGDKVPIRLRVQRVRAAARTLRFTLRVPRDTAPGRHVLTLVGTAADQTDDLGGADLISLVLGELDPSSSGGDPGARSLDELQQSFESVGRWDGVRGRIDRGDWFPALRDPQLRIAGRLKIALNVVR